ncbi:hypothetical protein [Moraxella sp. RCAD0137]|nr:hypothetical protein [Moraxella sp. RCAD0137]
MTFGSRMKYLSVPSQTDGRCLTGQAALGQPSKTAPRFIDMD